MFDATIADVCHAIWNMNAWILLSPFAIGLVVRILELWSSFKEEVLGRSRELDD